MESAYRSWIKRGSSNVWDSDQLHRGLQAALGTTKWQVSIISSLLWDLAFALPVDVANLVNHIKPPCDLFYCVYSSVFVSINIVD